MTTHSTIARPLILVTSFEPFGGSPVNPTIAIANLLAATTPLIGSHRFLALPVIGGMKPDSAWHAAARMIDTLQPDAVVALGESAKADRIHIETRAVNVRDSRIADNAGLQLRNEVVIAGAPHTHSTTLPTQDMARACESVGVAVTLSSDAGTFLCNELFFRLLERASVASTSAAHHNNFIAGFIHVPQLPEQASQRGGPHMDTHVAARAVHAMLHAVSSNLLPKLA